MSGVFHSYIFAVFIISSCFQTPCYNFIVGLLLIDVFSSSKCCDFPLMILICFVVQWVYLY